MADSPLMVPTLQWNLGSLSTFRAALAMGPRQNESPFGAVTPITVSHGEMKLELNRPLW